MCIRSIGVLLITETKLPEAVVGKRTKQTLTREGAAFALQTI